MLIPITCLLLICATTISVAGFDRNLTSGYREPRFIPDFAQLTFPYIPTLLIPPSATQRLQFIWGVGIPLSFSLESLIFGMVFKAAYFLPSYLRGPLSIQAVNFPGLQEGRRRRAAEQHEGILEVLEEEPLEDSSSEETFSQNTEERHTESENPQDERFTRWHAYTIMETLAKGYQLGEKECVLRAICEAATSPFSQYSGIMGEMLHILMTPSSSPDKLSKHSDNEYLYAEQVGQSQEPCDRVFKHCKGSLLELFTGQVDPLLYELKYDLK